MLRKKSLTFLAATAVVALLLHTGIAAAQSNVLRVRPFGDLKGIDPVTNSDYMARNHGYMIYDTLFAMDDKLQIKPQMLEKYETSADGLT
jgi:peptide/nickel transport system substrate-binding protein